MYSSACTGGVCNVKEDVFVVYCVLKQDVKLPLQDQVIRLKTQIAKLKEEILNLQLAEVCHTSVHVHVQVNSYILIAYA